MNHAPLKLITILILRLLRSVFYSPVLLTILGSLITTAAVYLEADIIKWLPRDFSFNQDDLLQWWSIVAVGYAILSAALRRLYPRIPSQNLLKSYIISLIVLTGAFAAFLFTINGLGLLLGNSLIFYAVWYALMAIFLGISTLISKAILKVESL